MSDINDLKFTIEPEETIEIEQFVNVISDSTKSVVTFEDVNVITTSSL